ncbi:HNH endonuclease [Cupriavidus sp. AU9028]|uniref:HNH endonuclease n=1 Tax=Cupriavidus sp. AU9028 TaxID=2871157 RepID=UPI001C956A1B|nr:HNH endonuclease signature motif containing protein [Cupriavidus sp. AU9028]MBY4898626.1 HNH endonuclease [Cupriavidus sp. AU9028]
MNDRVRKALSRLTRQHFEAAALAWDPIEGYPPFYVAPRQWYVIINRRHYPPRAITALAIELAGFGRLTPADFARSNRLLHKTLQALKFRVVELGVGQHARKRVNLEIGLAVGQRARPDDIDATHVRAAAKQWSRDRSFQNFGDSLRYDVLVDPRADGNIKPFPPKAIVAIAAMKAGFAPLRTNQFSGAKNGAWHGRLQELGFEIVDKRPGSTRTVKVTHRPGTASAAADRKDLQKALRGRQPVIVENDPEDDMLDALIRDPSLPDSVRRKVATRLGQGKFRERLMVAYGGRCVLSGIDVPEVLRAAHIKAWAKCEADPTARHDLHNGLLLHVTYDSLFEAGLIAFDDTGRILIATLLTTEQRSKLGLNSAMRLPGTVSPRRLGFLRAHRNAHHDKGRRYE